MLGNFLKRLGGGARPAPTSSRLAEQLVYYPPWHVPNLGTNGAYPGSSALLLDEQAFRTNLQAYLLAVPVRIAQLAGLLAAFDLDVADAYDESKRPDFIRALHLMLAHELPALYRPELRDFLAWESSTRGGDRIVFSLLGDLAMLFADVLRNAKPGCFIGMNLDPGDREMTSYGRPTLLGLSDGLFPGTPMLMDFEDEMFGVYRRMDDPDINFVDATRVDRNVGNALIGNTVLEACTRFVVEPDLPERRASTWMARAV